MPSRLLLITPVFYDLEKTIKTEIEKSGYEVVYIENKTLMLDYHGEKAKFKFLRRIYFLLFSPGLVISEKNLKKSGKSGLISFFRLTVM